MKTSQTKYELILKACQFAVLSMIGNGSSGFGAKKDGVFEKIEWSEVLDWLLEKQEEAQKE